MRSREIAMEKMMLEKKKNKNGTRFSYMKARYEFKLTPQVFLEHKVKSHLTRVTLISAFH